MSGVFNIGQIVQRRGMADWYPSDHKEKTMSTRKTTEPAAISPDAILALFKPGAWMKKSALASALGVAPDALTYHLGKLLVERQLIARGATSQRQFALLGTEGAEKPMRPKAAKKPKRAAATRRVASKPLQTKALAPLAAAEPECNVGEFTPALTDDDRLVIIRNAKALIFSHDQTRSLAGVLREHFRA